MSGLRYAVVGGGIIGAAVSRRLMQLEPDAKVTLLEKEDQLATHQTGRNSGVVHAGLYYPSGSLKATLCRRGVGLLKDFCAQHDITYDECGKVLVALDAEEQSRLDGIAERARANGVPGIRQLDGAELREIEPHVSGVAGLHSPSTAIVDYGLITRQLAADAEAAGATVRTGWPVSGVRSGTDEVVLTGRPTSSSPSTGSSCAPVCTPTGSPRWPRTSTSRRSCPSAVSTSRSAPRSATWSGDSSTRCRTRGTRSSACT